VTNTAHFYNRKTFRWRTIILNMLLSCVSWLNGNIDSSSLWCNIPCFKQACTLTSRVWKKERHFYSEVTLLHVKQKENNLKCFFFECFWSQNWYWCASNGSRKSQNVLGESCIGQVSILQGGSNMNGTDLCVNKPHCAAAVRHWESEATTSTLPLARVRTCSVLSGCC